MNSTHSSYNLHAGENPHLHISTKTNNNHTYSMHTGGDYSHAYTTVDAGHLHSYPYYATSAVYDGDIIKKEKINISKHAALLALVLFGNVVSNTHIKPTNTYAFSSYVRNERALAQLKERLGRKLRRFIIGDDLFRSEQLRDI